MRLSSPLLVTAGAVLAIAVAVTVIFFVERRDAGVPPETAAPATDSDSDPTAAERARSTAGSPKPPDSSSPARTVAEIVSDLRATELPRGVNRERLLRELVATGGDEAIVAIAALLADPAFDMPRRAAVFAEVLRGVEDRRIFEAARAALQRQLDAGETSADSLEGYIELVARNGGHDGALTLHALLEKSSGDLDTAVAAAVAVSPDRTLGSAFLDLVRSGQTADSRKLFESLVSWNDPALVEDISRLAWNDSIPTAVRIDAAELAGEALPPEALAPIAARYATAESAEEKSLVLRSLSGFALNERATPEALKAAALPVIETSLSDPDRRVWLDAVAILREQQVYRTPATLAALEALAAGLTSEGDVRLVQNAIKQVKKTTRGE